MNDETTYLSIQWDILYAQHDFFVAYFDFLSKCWTGCYRIKHFIMLHANYCFIFEISSINIHAMPISEYALCDNNASHTIFW